MEPNIIEKISTDLRNLPRTSAPKDLEQKLAAKITEYESSKLLGVKQTFPIVEFFKNPIFAPAFSLAVVVLLIFFTIQANDNLGNEIPLMLPKAESKLSEDNLFKDVLITNKKILPHKREVVVARTRSRKPLQLGPGVSLDASLPRSVFKVESVETNVSFSLPNEPTIIRIPPPAQYEPQRTVGFESATSRNRDSVNPILRRNR
jgi:hypothetical protein